MKPLLSRAQGLSISKFFSFIEWQSWLVFAIAVAVMIYIQVVYPFFNPGGDSDTDFFMAKYLLGMNGGQYITAHNPGMALFLIASGTLLLNTWKGMIAIYAIMSVAIPCFIYGISCCVS